MLKARFGVDFDAELRRALPFFFHPRVHPNALTAIGTAVSLVAALIAFRPRRAVGRRRAGRHHQT